MKKINLLSILVMFVIIILVSVVTEKEGRGCEGAAVLHYMCKKKIMLVANLSIPMMLNSPNISNSHKLV